MDLWPHKPYLRTYSNNYRSVVVILFITVLEKSGQTLGAVSFPPPYLAPNTQPDAIHGGINYASGASGILDKTGSLFVSIYNI